MKERIQYKHHLIDRKTFAVQVPEKWELLALMASFVEKEACTVNLGFGISKVHPLDQYSRKKGRVHSLDAMIFEGFKLHSLMTDTNGHYIRLRNKKYQIHLCLNRYKEIPHLSHIEELE